MKTDMLTMLRTLAEHIDHHDLADTLLSVGASFGELHIQIKDATSDGTATLRRWAVSLGEVITTAEPGSTGYDHVHVKLSGRLNDHPISVVWVATGTAAAKLRRVLGIAELPTFALDLDQLSGTTGSAAA